MIDTVVTGSNGFIGRHLIKKLGYAVCVPHYDISKWRSDSKQLFFLSTYGNMAHHGNRGMMVQANLTDLLTMLEYFNGWICYMSSSSVNLPVQTTYSRTKRVAEEILQSLPELKSCIVRPYSVTGVGEQKEHLIPTLIRSCMEGTPMDFVPDAIHDFVDVEDIVDGLLTLSKIKATGIHEFGNGIDYSNEDVKEAVEEAIGKKANIRKITKLREYDNTDWFCDKPSKYWNSTKTLYNSIEEMVEEYKLTHSKKES